AAASELNPGAAAGRDLVIDARTGIEQRRIHTRVLMNVDGAFRRARRGENSQSIAALFVGEELLLATWCNAFRGRLDPDLEEVHGLCFRAVEFAVHDSAAGAHALHFAAAQPAFATGAVAMRERALKH